MTKQKKQNCPQCHGTGKGNSLGQVAQRLFLGIVTMGCSEAFPYPYECHTCDGKGWIRDWNEE